MGFPSPQHTQSTGVEGRHSGRCWATPHVHLTELCSHVWVKSQVPESLKQLKTTRLQESWGHGPVTVSLPRLSQGGAEGVAQW